ncbi:MAG TPA: hypothetical protein P5077_08895 [bacterium]|nr:hypothetical protein [bacterium]
MKKNVARLGVPPWSGDSIARELCAFADLYEKRPLRDNAGGMRAPHMFAVWFMARKLSPDLIVESGIWKGQSTWLLRNACPDARIVSIDLNLALREHIEPTVAYSDKDFSEHDWSEVTQKSLVFFDDHQNALKRLQQCKWFGFKHIIFEDNYPTTQGDCYSLKKAFAHAGFEPAFSKGKIKETATWGRLKERLAERMGITPITLTPQYDSVKVHPNEHDAKMVEKNVEVYCEFPPVIKTVKTRWGDDWDEAVYPTPDPVTTVEDISKDPRLEAFVKEATAYTWICYVRLK